VTNPQLFERGLVDYMLCTASDPASDRAISRFLASGLDSNSSNIGKHINDEERMPIPKLHCVHYSQTESRREIVYRLYAVVTYCARSGEREGGRPGEGFAPLCRRLQAELDWASETLRQTRQGDALLLANSIYEIVLTHLRSRRRRDPVPQSPAPRRVDMDEQVREYYLTCDCYEANSLDFFLALRRMAERNVIAASNLGGFYYIGMQFVVKNEAGGSAGKFVVEKNYDQAVTYFQWAAGSQPPYAPALYSLGYMYLHGEAGLELAESERLAEAERYLRLAAEQNFHHALSCLGEMAMRRAEPLLTALEAGLPVDRPALIGELRRALEDFDRAAELGSVFGQMHAARFLDEPRWRGLLPEILAGAALRGGRDARSRWQRAVEMENVWAMDQLALLDCREGRREEARELLRRAEGYNYPDASLHLAERFFAPDGLEPDPVQYLARLERASGNGSPRAGLLLADAAGDDSARAEKYLRRALEQNAERFDNGLYQAIRSRLNALRDNGDRGTPGA
jgi:TPR repeat protein